MGLIKSIDAPPAASAFSMRDIEQQAHAIILRAKDQAGRLLAEAQRVGETLKQRAEERGQTAGREAGFAQGLADGQAAGKQEALNEQRDALATLITALSETATHLDASRRQLESEACVDVMRLAIAIARRVTHQLAVADPSIVTANIKEAMKLAVRASHVKIAIHPSQKAALEAALPELKMSWPTLEHVTLMEDESLTPGGCRLFTDGGVIDADLNQQIDRIASDLIPANADGTADERR